jgi:hypothetical protein
MFKALVVVAIAAVVVTHAPSDLRPVKKAAAHARTVVSSHVHAATARVSRTWARLKRNKKVERLERVWSLELPEAAVRAQRG